MLINKCKTPTEKSEYKCGNSGELYTQKSKAETQSKSVKVHQNKDK